MSAFHNSEEGEQLAKRFHLVCLGVGLVHVVLGVCMVMWHGKGAQDHENNLQSLRKDG